MIKKIFLPFPLLLLLLIPMSLSAQLHNLPITKTTVQQGIVKGVHDSGISIFKGIPFARPPVGPLRWQPPQDAQPWEGTYKATHFSSGCMQLPVFDDMQFRYDGLSEDCLYLNIWTPATNPNQKLPVLLYYYGGGFMAGDASEPRYDGASMARNHGIISITANYRLGVFGFLAHPALTKESPHQASGNYGLLDQSKALQWVKKNIASFGGDPDNITIAGESAGSISVSAQMASPLSRNLIAGAIGESGSIMGTLPAKPLKKAEQQGQSFAKTLKASSLKELRALSAQELLKASGLPSSPRFSPTLDGYFFPKSPEDIYLAGEQADVPLFVGWNSKEMGYQFIMGGQKPTPKNYARRLDELFGDRAEKALELYPGSSVKEVVHSATDLAGDQFIGYSTWKWSALHSQKRNTPVYRYYYTHPRPPQKSQLESPSRANKDKAPAKSFSQPEGAVHAAEIEYIMGNLPYNKTFAWTPVDYKVSDIFQHYAANFVKTKNPNGKGLPYWQAINQSVSPQVMYIGSTTEMKAEQHRERYLFLDQSMN